MKKLAKPKKPRAPTRVDLETEIRALKAAQPLQQIGHAGALLTVIADHVTKGDIKKVTLSSVLEETDQLAAQTEWRKRLSSIFGGI